MCTQQLSNCYTVMTEVQSTTRTTCSTKWAEGSKIIHLNGIFPFVKRVKKNWKKRDANKKFWAQSDNTAAPHVLLFVCIHLNCIYSYRSPFNYSYLNGYSFIVYSSQCFNCVTATMCHLYTFYPIHLHGRESH